MTILPRAATGGELTKLRSGNQSSRLFLTVHAPATIYTARLTSAPSSNDNVTTISYNTGSGTFTSVVVDSTMYVGSTAGAYDLGMVRVHNTGGMGATSGTIDIGRTSEIDWVGNPTAYLTCVDAFDLWARPPWVDANGVLYMDYDYNYSNQHSLCKSTPVFGGRYKVKWLPNGGTVNALPDASQSWALNNTINSYQWVATGASATSGMTTATPTITYNAASAHAGYRVDLTVGNTDSVLTVSHGRVFVLAAETDAYEITMPVTVQGSYQSGGWSAQVTMYFDADRATIRDRALCILHRKDWYGPTASDAGSLGYVADDENIELVGWIAGESIKWLSEDKPGYVTFTIQGPQYWLDRITMPPVGLKNISSHAPTNWKRFTGLTAKAVTWHILHWRTTAPVMMDCFAANSTVGALQFQASGAQTVWQQLSNVLNDFVIAKPCCDAYARLFMQIEQNLLPSSSRSSIPTVMTITKDDWSNEIDFDRKILNNIAGIDLNGEIYDGTTTTAVYALSPGRAFSASGAGIFKRERLAVLDQASINALAGAAFGWQNPNYPNWRFVLASNMHLIDLAPYQYLAIDIASSDTVRGFTASGLRLIPRDIKRTFQNGVVTPEISIEAEATIGLGITGDTPPTPPSSDGNPPPPPPIHPPLPAPPNNANGVWQMHLKIGTGHVLTWTGDYDFTSATQQPTWNAYTTWPALFDNPSIPGRFAMLSNRTFACISNSTIGIWKLTNAAAMVATPATLPTWSSVIAVGDAVPGGTLTSVNNLDAWGSVILINATRNDGRALYGEYDGTTLTWTVLPNSGLVAITHLLYDIPTGAGVDHVAVLTTGGVLQHSFSWDFGAAVATAMCRNYNNSTAYIGWYDGTGTHTMHIANAVTGADLINTGVATRFTTSVRTSLYGAGVFVTLDNGSSWISTDGTTFTAGASFVSDGQILDGNRNGGGSLVWTVANTGSNEINRISLDHGTTYANKTGNFWSVVASTNLTFCGSQLTFA